MWEYKAEMNSTTLGHTSQGAHKGYRRAQPLLMRLAFGDEY